MKATLHIYKSTLDDLQNALDWYATQSQGLEARFHKAVDERLNFIANNPLAAPFRMEGFRGTPIKKFPYMVYYDFDSKKNIVSIVAVLHTRRDNRLLKNRKQ
ncbi:MAG: type II toxin-antitoxin system RelE/ParE family toxin [Bacteroidota bacterium]